MKSALTNALPSGKVEPAAIATPTLPATAIAAVLGATAVPDSIDDAREAAHWKAAYQSRPYVARGASFDDFGPAYAFGILSYRRTPGRSFDEAEPDLSRGWVADRAGSTLTWELARPASREAWERVRAPYKVTR